MNTENLIIHIFDEENMKKKYDRGSNLHEDSVLRFDDQLAFVLKYYTPSLSLEINGPLNYYKW